MRTARFATARRIFAAALIGVSALALSTFAVADRDHDGRGSKKVKRAEALVLTNGKIYTMDASNRVVNEVLIENGRVVEAGKHVDRSGRVKIIDLKGHTVVPGIIDAHNHIVLVGNRPGWHTPMEHVFTIPDAIAAYQARAAQVPPGEFITTIGPIAARQFAEQRLPELPELNAIPRPVYIQAAQGGSRANTEAAAWFASRNPAVTVNPTTGAVSGPALQTLREQLLTTSHAIHADPELLFKEHRASARLAGELERGGLGVTRGVGGPYGRGVDEGRPPASSGDRPRSRSWHCLGPWEVVGGGWGGRQRRPQ